MYIKIQKVFSYEPVSDVAHGPLVIGGIFSCVKLDKLYSSVIKNTLFTTAVD
jgi:hypothetical protein